MDEGGAAGVYKRADAVTVTDLMEHLKHMPAAERDQLIDKLIGALSEAGTADRMLAWDQLSSMAGSRVDVGNHTDTHPLLPYETANTVETELRVSQTKLNANLNATQDGFAYPNGVWDAATRAQVQKSGFSYAVTTRSGWFRKGDDPFLVNRILLHQGNVSGPDGEFSAAAFSLTLTGWR